MDIVDFWDQLITQWKAESKCGFCWTFEAPLIESQSNIIQTEQGSECCIDVILTDVVERESSKYHPITELENGLNEDFSFTIHFVMEGELGENNYTEVKGHLKSDSRYIKTYKPIRECLDRNELKTALCEYTGKQVDITDWSKQISHAYLDQNYFGWKVKANFRIVE